MSTPTQSFAMVLAALDFAARQHQFQHRKGYSKIPYINHPIRVMLTLSADGQVTDPQVLAAAALHDVIEDTDCTPEELGRRFGKEVLDIVLEVTDDKTLDKDARKRRQVEKAPHISVQGRMIKIADKMANMKDILFSPPDWPRKRKVDYFKWAYEVVQGCRGVNPGLEEAFDRLYSDGMLALS